MANGLSPRYAFHRATLSAQHGAEHTVHLPLRVAKYSLSNRAVLRKRVPSASRTNESR